MEPAFTPALGEFDHVLRRANGKFVTLLPLANGGEPLWVINRKGVEQLGLLPGDETALARNDDPPSRVDEIQVIFEIERQVVERVPVLGCDKGQESRLVEFTSCGRARMHCSPPVLSRRKVALFDGDCPLCADRI